MKHYDFSLNNKTEMEIFFGGTSGGADSSTLGFKTTSVAVHVPDKNLGLIFDQGNGIEEASKFLERKGIASLDIFQSHYHHDHIEGMRKNVFLWKKDFPINVFAPDKIIPHEFDTSFDYVNGESLFDNHFNYFHYPVKPFADLNFQNSLGYRDVTYPEMFSFDQYHPGGSIGYSYIHRGRKIVFATDNELGVVEKYESVYVKAIKNADVLIADLQYSNTEYFGEKSLSFGTAPISLVGRGHSCPLALASILTSMKKHERPKVVVATHHHHKRSKEEFKKHKEEMKKFFKNIRGVRFIFAEDGSTIKI